MKMTKEKTKKEIQVNMVSLIEYGILLGDKHTSTAILLMLRGLTNTKLDNIEYIKRIKMLREAFNKILKKNSKILKLYKDECFKEINLRLDIEHFERELNQGRQRELTQCSEMFVKRP